MSIYDSLVKRLPWFIDSTSNILQKLLTVVADLIDELDDEIQGASEINQTKKKLRQILSEWKLDASSVCSVENLQNILRHRFDYHSKRGSEQGILNDIEMLCNSGANIYSNPPVLEWYLDINYPFEGDGEDSPLDYSDACFGYLIDLGIAIRFQIDNNAKTEAEILDILRKNSMPVHLDALLDVVEDSFNYLMLEENLNWM